MVKSPLFPRARAVVRATLVVLAAGIVLPLAVAAPASAADETVGISARPAGENGQPDARTRFSYSADPGQHIDDRFLVTNTGTSEQAFRVVGTDAFNDGDGQYALLATDDQPTAIGQWVHFENGASRIEFTLQPGQSRVLPFSIDLPAEATPGDHAGGLVASVVTPGDQVNLDRRVATRMYVRVSGELQPALSVSSIDANYTGEWWNLLNGTVAVRYTVENTGNVALASNVTAGVHTWFGIPAAPDQGGSIDELLPGNRAAYEFEVHGVAQWLYLSASLKLNPFVDSPDAANQLPVASTTRDAVTWAVPWLLVIGLVLVLAVLAFLFWRRRRDVAQAQAWIAYTQEQARAEAQKEAQLLTSGAREGASDG